MSAAVAVVARARALASLAMVTRAMLSHTPFIEVYDTPTQYPVPKRKSVGRLASAFAVVLTLVTIGLVAAGIFVQRL